MKLVLDQQIALVVELALLRAPVVDRRPGDERTGISKGSLVFRHSALVELGVGVTRLYHLRGFRAACLFDGIQQRRLMGRCAAGEQQDDQITHWFPPFVESYSTGQAA